VQADPERLMTVFEHLTRNTPDATRKRPDCDRSQPHESSCKRINHVTGEGMSPEFIPEGLFRLFDSTKGSQCMGIGAY